MPVNNVAAGPVRHSRLQSPFRDGNKYQGQDGQGLMALMQLGVKCGETVKVTIEGEDEDVAFAGIKEFFEANL